MVREGIERGVSGRVQRSTPDLFRTLRHSRVMVFHPGIRMVNC